MKKIIIVFGLILFYVLINSQDDLFIKLDKVLIESQYKEPIRYTKISENVYVFDSAFLKSHNIYTIKDLVQLISRTYLGRYRSGNYLIFANGIINSHNERFLILVDGIPINDPFYNQVLIGEYLPLVNIKQIEVSFGPFSSLYGTGGFAGYINIIHKKTNEKKISIGFQNTNMLNANFILNYAYKKMHFNFVISYLDDGGVGIDKTYSGAPVLVDDFPTNDYFIESDFMLDNFSFSVMSIGYKQFELNNPMYTWGNIYKNRIYNYVFNDVFFTTKYKIKINNKFKIKIMSYYGIYNRQDVWGYDVYSSTDPLQMEETRLINPHKDSEKAIGEVNINYSNNKLNVLLGFLAEYINLKDIKDYTYINNQENYLIPSPYYLDPTSYMNYASFIQWRLNLFTKLNTNISIRYDYNHFFKDFISPKINIGYTVNNNLSFGFTYGRAFRSPTPRELLIKTSDWTEGNINLKPEEIESFSLVSKVLTKNWNISIDIFKQYLRNLIDKIEVMPQKYSYDNVGVENILGSSLFANYFYHKWTLTADITYTHAKVENKEQYSYPKIKITQTIMYRFNKFLQCSFDSIYVGIRPRHDWNSLKNDGKPYMLNNLNIMFKKGNTYANFYIKNIFNTPYYTMYYVNNVNNNDYKYDLKMPGRIIGIKLSYVF